MLTIDLRRTYTKGKCIRRQNQVYTVGRWYFTEIVAFYRKTLPARVGVFVLCLEMEWQRLTVLLLDFFCVKDEWVIVWSGDIVFLETRYYMKMKAQDISPFSIVSFWELLRERLSNWSFAVDWLTLGYSSQFSQQCLYINKSGLLISKQMTTKSLVLILETKIVRIKLN